MGGVESIANSGPLLSQGDSGGATAEREVVSPLAIFLGRLTTGVAAAYADCNGVYPLSVFQEDSMRTIFSDSGITSTAITRYLPSFVKQINKEGILPIGHPLEGHAVTVDATGLQIIGAMAHTAQERDYHPRKNPDTASIPGMRDEMMRELGEEHPVSQSLKAWSEGQEARKSKKRVPESARGVHTDSTLWGTVFVEEQALTRTLTSRRLEKTLGANPLPNDEGLLDAKISPAITKEHGPVIALAALIFYAPEHMPEKINQLTVVEARSVTRQLMAQLRIGEAEGSEGREQMMQGIFERLHTIRDAQLQNQTQNV